MNPDELVAKVEEIKADLSNAMTAIEAMTEATAGLVGRQAKGQMDQIQSGITRIERKREERDDRQEKLIGHFRDVKSRIQMGENRLKRKVSVQRHGLTRQLGETLQKVDALYVYLRALGEIAILSPALARPDAGPEAVLHAEEAEGSARTIMRSSQASLGELQQKFKVVPVPADESPEQHRFDSLQSGRDAIMRMREAEGGAWTGGQLKTHFNLNPALLHKRRKDYRIVWWRDAKNNFFYPKWQFRDDGSLFPGVADVVRTFRSDDEWRVMRYFLGRRHQLDDHRPLDLLRNGEVDKVLAHAEQHAAENTW